MDLYVHQNEKIYKVSSEVPYSKIYETKSLLFELVSNVELNSPVLFISDMKIDCSKMSKSSDQFRYLSDSGCYFINNVGIALIEYEDDDGSDKLSLGAINILSSKVTINRLKSMLEYICSVDAKLLHCCFSKTFISAYGSKFEHVDLLYKLISTEKTVNFLWENRNRFKSQPCKRVKTIEVVKNYVESDLMDDRGYSWIFSHLDELEFTTDNNDVVLNRYGKNLTVRHVSTSRVVDDTDVFENQVIYTFLISVKRFIESVDNVCNYYNHDFDLNSEYIDIVPYIQNFISDKFNFRRKLILRIKSLVDNCVKFININFTKTYVSNFRPRVTQYAARHNHYVSLYKMMNDWWSIDASNVSEYESIERLLFSIRSMDKLYEIFVLLKILNSFQVKALLLTDAKYVDFNCFPSLNISKELEKKSLDFYNYFHLEDEYVVVNIYFEPIIFPHRENLEDGELFIVDKHTQLRSADNLTKAKKIRTPDYVVEIISKRKNSRMIYVLDAKYSKFETVLYDRLPSRSVSKNRKNSPGLIEKYLYGIRIFREDMTPRMIDGIFATYIVGKPEVRRKVIHGVSEAYGLWGEFPIRPFVDLVEFAPDIKEGGDEMSVEFIDKLYEYTLGVFNSEG